MKVTLVDSEPAVVGLIDCLEHLPTQPPSLYLDIEGVRLSRHGSISLIQLFVCPQQHIYLIDVFVLKEAAFSTANGLGTTFRSILESGHVPKVFFDVRHDSDALFAHFEISLQCVHDLQLFELAACPHLRERVSGLGTCIERDAQLPRKDVAVWKATKQKGLSRFSPEHGGSYNVFNARPMSQDIVEYCTQDVVYLPVLWKVYSRKISPKWMKKVMHESRERISASQKASYELTGKERSLSPWTKSAKSGRDAQQGGNGAGGPERKTVVAGTLRQFSKGTVLEGPLSRLDFPKKSSAELEAGSREKTTLVERCATSPSSWTCVTCSRKMQQDQKEDHLAGKQHIARVKQTPTLQTNTPKGKPVKPMKGSQKGPQLGGSAANSARRKTKGEDAKDPGITNKNWQAAVSQSQRIGQPYPPDQLFIGFQGGAAPANHQYETLYDLDDVEYETSWPFENVDYNACDKDCGWCGHCMDGLDA
ncbi:MAG: hypothetical protein OHK93_001253 [Ramalina farinacea]|uniref:3'-5' exonuclease domain-containing protein n=1 Tax=Ramalina farinacea TaxID=258253 RepID=A0AA43QR73_9LECA|nr:hypothetical protein [Ramalina farinacea]